jgi:hypothetical protein
MTPRRPSLFLTAALAALALLGDREKAADQV